MEDFNEIDILIDYFTENSRIKVKKDNEQEIGMEGLLLITKKQTTLSAIERAKQTLALIRSQKLRATDDATILVIMYEEIASEASPSKNENQS